jgi:hypothetical protein
LLLAEAEMLMRGGCFFVVVVVVVTMFRLWLLEVVVRCWPDDLVDDIAICTRPFTTWP